MSTAKSRAMTRSDYEQAAADYCSNLPLEHFMESTPQGTQREITLESLALVKARRKDVHVYNELLVQYPRSRGGKLGQVVPDNMVVISDDPPDPRGNYDLPFQPAPPFWVLEYVSASNKRKDYEDSFRKYERQLKIQYYLLFNPEDQELILYRHDGRRYVMVRPDVDGQYPITELELKVALRDGWVRFWMRGELLPLPADLQRNLDEARRQLQNLRVVVEAATQRADGEKQRADGEKQRADSLEARLQQAEQARLAAERELANLRLQREPAPSRRPKAP